jgi:hypothetical protein
MGEDLGRVVYLILRSLLLAWSSHAPEGVPQKVWFYIWTVLLFSFGVFIIACFIELLKQVSTNRDLAQNILARLGTRLKDSIEPLRIVVPQYLKAPLYVCMLALFLAAIGH